jgi:hypothetical protein
MALPAANPSNTDLDISNSDWTNLSVSDPDTTNSSVTNPDAAIPDAEIPRIYLISDEALVSVLLICVAGLYITLNFQL